jgi:N-acetylneuraminate synthase/N,N'-diacetyllegionaminate synthase
MPNAFNEVIHIEGREIGAGRPVFVIAEIGVNHNGSLELATEMIRAAAECGVDCVKFQTFDADEFMAKRGVTYQYTSAGNAVTEDMYEMFKRLELPLDWHVELFQYARSLGLVPLTSVADPGSVAVADAAGVAAYKLSSEDFINLPLLQHVCGKGKPLLLSTGMADEEEVADALGILKNSTVKDVIFLHCVSVYPTPDDEAQLGRMVALARKTNAPVGYSDHTLGGTACIAAVALGACVIEKHFTIDKNIEGPDQALSADPGEMTAIVREIRRIEKMGFGNIRAISPSKTEMVMRPSFRRSLVAAENLPAGTIITKTHLKLQRAGVEGIRYRDIDFLLGKTLKHTITKGTPVLPVDLH